MQPMSFGDLFIAQCGDDGKPLGAHPDRQVRQHVQGAGVRPRHVVDDQQDRTVPAESRQGDVEGRQSIPARGRGAAARRETGVQARERAENLVGQRPVRRGEPSLEGADQR